MTHGGLYGKIFIAQWKQKMNRLYKSGRFWDGNDAGVETDQWIIQKYFLYLLVQELSHWQNAKYKRKKGRKFFGFYLESL